ncbi:response regulator transcription factor [Furfurilactobacillus siliginis]|uniref:DNA-binding response regulator n=1 Tax=Furfurilactobacillus siliginis TaxID=348151 RepID=A0A0R2L237_9LACO|nr:response regulator transcription factor [Furfurilactobacillus siliginis]KRN95742.1 OmpR family DNA-binding response regulator [Furfurilactobacillus siliginis]GEK27996.1 DNA-binding response regulator [Furfurilactobacillus siliginis]
MDQLARGLIVEDEQAVSDNIKELLAKTLTCDQAFDGEDGEFKATQGIYDLIILDWMLPMESGLDVLKAIRAQHLDVPVLFLTAKDGLDDKIRGFNLGADDYLTKPFHREELLLRVRALLKRSGHLANENILTMDDITINLQNHAVTVRDETIQLNGKEFDLLVYFMQNQGTIITKDQIFDRLWGFDSETSITVVEVYVSNLRKKLKPTGADQYIKTLRNAGYLINAES